MRLSLAVAAVAFPTMLVAQQSPARQVETAIRGLEEQWRAAQQSNDTAAFRKLLAPEVTFIGTSGSLRNRSGYIGSCAQSWIPRAVTESKILPRP